MVKVLDDSIGRIMTTLEHYKMENNTLIIFTTDNGGQNADGGNNWPLRGNKANNFEGGVRGFGFAWGEMLAKKSMTSALMHVTDWVPTLVNAAGGTISDKFKVTGVN